MKTDYKKKCEDLSILLQRQEGVIIEQQNKITKLAGVVADQSRELNYYLEVKS